jgi:glycine dehydrogenase subunit 1
VVDGLVEKGVLAGVPASRLYPHDPALRDLLIVAATETVTDADCETFAGALAEVLS